MNLPSALQYAGLGGAVTSLTSGTILAPTDGELALDWALLATAPAWWCTGICKTTLGYLGSDCWLAPAALRHSMTLAQQVWPIPCADQTWYDYRCPAHCVQRLSGKLSPS